MCGTQAAKSFIKQLVNVSKGAEFDGLEEKLIEVNPVLEAFGNAKTKVKGCARRYPPYLLRSRHTPASCVPCALR